MKSAYFIACYSKGNNVYLEIDEGQLPDHPYAWANVAFDLVRLGAFKPVRWSLMPRISDFVPRTKLSVTLREGSFNKIYKWKIK